MGGADVQEWEVAVFGAVGIGSGFSSLRAVQSVLQDLDFVGRRGCPILEL